jgi:hypothetical protein
MFEKILRGIDWNRRIILLFVAFIMLTLLVDTSIIKLYDLSSKRDISIDLKKIAFSAIVFTCLILQIILLQYTRTAIKNQSRVTRSSNLFYNVALLSYALTIILISLLIIQLFYLKYYNSLILISIVFTTYGTASFFIGRTTVLFISWYKRSHDFVILMYVVSMSLLVFNLIVTSIVVNAYLSDRPERVREFVGGSMDLSAGKNSFLVLLHKVSSVLSFLSIWMATVVLSYSSRDELVRKLRHLIMPTLLLVYFLFSYFSQDIFTPILVPLLQSDPVLLSTILLLIFTLIKPVGGIIFGIAFWKISKTVDYEKTLQKFLIITGYGFLFLFSANQSTSLVLAPYPPFGVGTITILIIGSYLIMIGIFTSATLVSKSNDLRRSIHKVAKESRLLGLIGTAEMEKEVNKTVNKIVKEVGTSEEFVEANLEIDKIELRNYLGEVIEQLRKNRSISS